MLHDVTVERHNDKLEKVLERLDEFEERWKKVGVYDDIPRVNQTVQFTRHLELMLKLARAITMGALKRNESRGAHYKPEFPERNDKDFLKTTIARYTDDGPEFSYEDVDVSQSKPRLRSYAKKGAAAGLAKPEEK